MSVTPLADPSLHVSPRADIVGELVRIGALCSAMAVGVPPRRILTMVLGHLREMTGATGICLLVEDRVIQALGSPLERNLAQIELEGRAQIVSKGPIADEIRDWEGSSAPIVSLAAADLIVPGRRGGVKVTEPYATALSDPARVALLHLLVDLAHGLAVHAADQAEAEQKAATLEETRARLREQNLLLRELAVVDELTGLHNRRFFEGRIQYELDRVQRYATPLALMVMDIDHFKAVNDTYGHPAGDAVLRQLAALAQARVRRVDLLARVGGEEFALLMPNTDEQGAQIVSQRLLESVRLRTFRVLDRDLNLTVSMGLAAVAGGWSGDPAQLFRAADQALYRAKLEGRDRLLLAQQG